jgi:hypothetical protein
MSHDTHNDESLMSLVAQSGHHMNQLFLVGESVYVSADFGSFQAHASYAPFERLSESQRTALVALLKRLDAVSYPSVEAVDAEILQAVHWEAIYAELEALLSGLPFATANGSATYYVVEYGRGQHKVECTAWEYFDSTVLNAIQAVLRKHVNQWEVILVGGPELGPQQAVSIFPESIIPRWSTAQWYEDDA